jgi:putative flippase GtrA
VIEHLSENTSELVEPLASRRCPESVSNEPLTSACGEGLTPSDPQVLEMTYGTSAALHPVVRQPSKADRADKTSLMVRTGISGVIATVIDVTTLIFLVEVVRVPVALAAFLGAASGAGANYVVSKYWAFKETAPVNVKQLLTFGIVALCTACFMAAAMQVFAVGMGLPYLAAKGIAAALVFVLWSYPAQARWVFRAAERAADLTVEVAHEMRESMEMDVATVDET